MVICPTCLWASIWPLSLKQPPYGDRIQVPGFLLRSEVWLFTLLRLCGKWMSPPYSGRKVWIPDTSWAFLGRIKPHRSALTNSDMLRNCGSPHICCYPTINGCPPKRCQTWIHIRHHASWTPKSSLKTLSQNLRGFGGVIFLICVCVYD